MTSMRRMILFLTALAIAQGQSAAAVWAYAAQDLLAPESCQELGEPLDAASHGATATALVASSHLRPLATSSSSQVMFQSQLRDVAYHDPLVLGRPPHAQVLGRRYRTLRETAALVLLVFWNQHAVQLHPKTFWRVTPEGRPLPVRRSTTTLLAASGDQWPVAPLRSQEDRRGPSGGRTRLGDVRWVSWRSLDSHHGLWPWARSGFRPMGEERGTTGSAHGAPWARGPPA